MIFGGSSIYIVCVAKCELFLFCQHPDNLCQLFLFPTGLMQCLNKDNKESVYEYSNQDLSLAMVVNEMSSDVFLVCVIFEMLHLKAFSLNRRITVGSALCFSGLHCG